MRSYGYWVVDEKTREIRTFDSFEEASEFARPILKWITYNVHSGTNFRQWDWHFQRVHNHLGFSFTYEEHAMMFKLGWSDVTESSQVLYERIRQQRGW